MLTIRELTVHLQKKEVLKNVSLNGLEGTITSIIGPNGAGKSTLLKALIGLQPIHQGEVSWKGQSIQSYTSIERAQQMTLLSQGKPHPLPFTVEEFVTLGVLSYAKEWSTEQQQQTVAASLKRHHLWPYRKRSIHQLSGGEWQRVYMAKIEAQQADLLLLDEPTTFLDVHYRTHFYEWMVEMRAAGKTILWVSHDINDTIRYADQVVALKEGELITQGPTMEIMNQSTLEELFQTRLSPVRKEKDERTYFLPYSSFS